MRLTDSLDEVQDVIISAYAGGTQIPAARSHEIVLKSLNVLYSPF